MNLFKKYAKDIKHIILKNKNSLNINNISNIDNIIVESPPEQFDYDLSSNVAMVLSKINNENPRNLAENLRTILINNINDWKSAPLWNKNQIKKATRNWFKYLK